MSGRSLGELTIGDLTLGMHADMPGHSFILVDRHGVIRWRHDYTKMHVPPGELLKAIPNID